MQICVPLHAWCPEEGVRFPGALVCDCELPCACWKLNLSPEEQPVLLTIKLSLQLQQLHLLCWTSLSPFMKVVVEITSPDSHFHQKIFCQTVTKAKWPFEGGFYFLYFSSWNCNCCYVRGLCMPIWWKRTWGKNHLGSLSQVWKLCTKHSMS